MRRAKKEKGVAMILALLLVLATSVIAISLVSVSRTDGFASMNYRLMSQSRDAAEGGVHKAANFIIKSYSKPGSVSDPMSNYTTTTSPVTDASGNVITLSAKSGVTSHYPLSSVQTAFNSAAQGSVAAGSSTVNYATTATLVSMGQITPYGSTTPAAIQTWLLTSDGSVSGMQNADVEVTSTLEQQAVPVFTYAAFATNTGCSALSFGGGGTTDSYNSGSITYTSGNVVTQQYGGSVGTNGNLSTNGNPTTIYGNLSTPRTGVGTCTTNNVTAWTDTSGHVTGSIVQLPVKVSYPTPTIPSPGSTDLSIGSNQTCSGLGLSAPQCYASGKEIYIAPGSYHNIAITGNENVHFSPGIYDINSLTETSAQSGLIIDEYPCSSPCLSAIDPNVSTSTTVTNVVLNVSGTGVSGNVIDLTGNSVQNPSLNPMNFQLLYAGTGTIALKGNSTAAGLLYAPNASYSFGGNGDWYGAVIGGSLTDMGGAAIHYDRKLATTAYMAGPYTLGSFSWKKY